MHIRKRERDENREKDSSMTRIDVYLKIDIEFLNCFNSSGRAI